MCRFSLTGISSTVHQNIDWQKKHISWLKQFWKGKAEEHLWLSLKSPSRQTFMVIFNFSSLIDSYRNAGRLKTCRSHLLRFSKFCALKPASMVCCEIGVSLPSINDNQVPFITCNYWVRRSLRIAINDFLAITSWHFLDLCNTWWVIKELAINPPLSLKMRDKLRQNVSDNIRSKSQLSIICDPTTQ